MENNNYDWQNKVYEKWSTSGWRLLVDAHVSSGKTRAGAICIFEYLKFFGESRIWVLAPSRVILSQWKEEIGENPYIEYHTYISALNTLIRNVQTDCTDVPDLLVCDEAHTLTAPQSQKVLSFHIPHILALSGTPNGVEKVIGCDVMKVGWEESRIAPTIVYLTRFTPSQESLIPYNKWTNSIHKYEHDHPRSSWRNDRVLSMLYMRRRNACYSLPERFKIAKHIVDKGIENGERMMLFFARKKHAADFSKMLKKEGVEHSLHITGNEHLGDFLEKKTNILLCADKLNAGFSDESVTMGVIVSPTTGMIKNAQRVGRIIRFEESKTAKIFILVAENTSDKYLIDNKNQLFMKDCIKIISA